MFSPADFRVLVGAIKAHRCYASVSIVVMQLSGPKVIFGYKEDGIGLGRQI
jgi:hypothetical protein